MPEMIILRLEGVLQSWGENAKWDQRTTSSFPTKSAIVGLIACAMGLERGNSGIVQLSDSIKIGIRADRRGAIIKDFQTVQGMPKIVSAEGKPRSGNTLVTPRYYLNDASFMIVIETTEDWKNKICKAFENPEWVLFLGRKNCVPSCPVFDGVYSYRNIYEAICKHPASLRSEKIREYEVEEEMADGNSFTRSDMLVANRNFVRRKVWHGVLKENEK